MKGRKQRKEEIRWGSFLYYGHVFADILFHEVEDVAAKRWFTLVRMPVVKHCPLSQNYKKIS